MFKLSRFFDLFRNKATKDSPVVVISQNIDDKPEIKYVDCIITAYDIDDYRSGHIQFVGGDYVWPNKYITVYKYFIDPSLNLDPNDQIYKDIEFIHQKEAQTIAHESKHMSNGKFGNPIWMMTNYYEMSGLYAFDEVSAYATAYLTHKNPTHQEVCRAVSKGIDDLLNRKSVYISQHIDQIASVICFKFAARNTESTLMQNWEKPQRYSTKFNTIANEYLTFNGQGIRDENDAIPVELKDKLRQLRQVYEDATSQMLDKIIKKTKQIQQ